MLTHLLAFIEVPVAPVLLADPVLLRRLTQLRVPVSDWEWSLRGHVWCRHRHRGQETFRCSVQARATYDSR